MLVVDEATQLLLFFFLDEKEIKNQDCMN